MPECPVEIQNSADKILTAGTASLAQLPQKPSGKTSDNIQTEFTQNKNHKILSGVAVSAGVAIGRACFFNRSPKKQIKHKHIPASDIQYENTRLQNAAVILEEEFCKAKEEALLSSREQAEIIDAYIMLCRDPKLLGLSKGFISSQLICAEWALEKTIESLAATFAEIDSEYFSQRIEDVKSVGLRLNAILQTSDQSKTKLVEDNKNNDAKLEKTILLAHTLTPLDTLSLSKERVLGLVTEMGGKTSHTGILARSFHIPCVVGVNGLEDIEDGELIIVDGIGGFIIANPDEHDLARYIDLQSQFEDYERRILQDSVYPAETEDGIRISVYGNLEQATEIEQLIECGGEGIGLYRTEFSFMEAQDLEDEEALYQNYKSVVAALAPRLVVLRTLDIGGDKNFDDNKTEEENPALGLRAIRYSLRHQDSFRRQLRAMLRAAAHGSVAIMFPMISGLPELRMARSILEEVRQELITEGIPHGHEIPIGTMIELPSAVLQAQALAREADFFSIGTNDLIQYTLGIDRGNKYVSYLFQPLHPAVILAIKQVVDAAHQNGIPVCVCGEMASDPYSLPILLGMGIDELSITPQAIPAVKSLIRNSNTAEFSELLRQACHTDTAEEILHLVKQQVYSRFKTELSFFASLTDTDV